jgi:outer membrane lipoprotein-sorting protein
MSPAICAIFASILFSADPAVAGEESTTTPEPLQIIEQLEGLWNEINDYTCTLYSYIQKEGEEDIRTYDYRFMKPGWVYMKIIDGRDKGARVRYDPNTGKVTGAKGGFISFIKKTFDVDDPTVRSIRGHRVNETHMGMFIERARDYLEFGTVKFEGTETLEGQDVYVFEFRRDTPPEESDIVRERWWIDVVDILPVQFEEYDVSGKVARMNKIEDLRFNQGLTEKDFGI